MKKLISVLCLIGLMMQFSVPALAAGDGAAHGADSIYGEEVDEEPEPGSDESGSEADESAPGSDASDQGESEALPEAAEEETGAAAPEGEEAQSASDEDGQLVYDYADLRDYLGLASLDASIGPILLASDITLEDGETLELAGSDPVTLKSAAGGPYTLTRGASLVDDPLLSIGTGYSLTLVDIVLDGGATGATPVQAETTLVNNAGFFTMEDGAVLQNNNIGGYAGGGVYSRGTFVMNGGAITGNTAQDGGGGVYNAGDFTMAGGAISGNDGGGIYNNGTFTMTDGTITGNTTPYDGGGIFVMGSFEMRGGTIAGNTAALGGDVYIDAAAPMTVSGVLSIGSGGGGIYMNAWSSSIDAGGLEAGARIYLEGAADGRFDGDGKAAIATGYTDAMKDCFQTVGTSLGLEAGAGTLYLVRASGTQTPEERLRAEVANAAGKAGTTTIDLGGTVTLTNTTLEIPAGSQVRLTGGKLVRGSGASNVSMITVKGGLILEGITLEGEYIGTSRQGALVYVESTGTFEMKAGAILRGGATNYLGGAVYNAGAFTLSGGSITGNAAAFGGGVYNDDNGTFTMAGGSIGGNTATGSVDSAGGGLCSDGTFMMTGGTLIGNHSGVYGGGVYFYGGTSFTMAGGTIAGNTAGTAGGEAYLYAPLRLEPKGDVTIGRQGSPAGVWLASNAQIDLAGTLKAGSLVVLEGAADMESGTRVAVLKTSGTMAAAQQAMFTLLDAGYRLKLSGDKKSLLFEAVDLQGKIDAAAPGDVILLDGEVQLTGNEGLIIQGGRKVVLTGGSITRGPGFTGTMVTVMSGDNELTLKDITLDGAGTATAGTIVNNAGTLNIEGGAVLQNNNRISGASGGGAVTNTGTVNMSGGAITGNTNNSNGGAVCNDGGTFNLSGGSISGNTAGNSVNNAYGGGVYNNTSTFTMTGGTLFSNEAYSGGGVCLSYDCTFEISGGTITGNTASYSGGGLHCSSNSGNVLTMRGGSVTGNTAASMGGGMSVSGTFDMSGGTISGNQSARGGGVNSSATFTLTGGSITGNTALLSRSGTRSEGGGVHNTGSNDSHFIMAGGTISGNSAATGGGVCSSGGAFTLAGGTISGNTATGHYNIQGSGGGGVQNYNTATFEMTGGTITGNTAPLGGGVNSIGANTVANGGPTFTMAGGAITGNTATGSGGGVYNSYTASNPSTFTMAGGTISGNRAANGGGVYNAGASVSFTMADGAISGNTATGSAGGVYNSGNFVLQGGGINGNTAASYGGGMYNTSALQMTGGAITANKARQSGGGAYNISAFQMAGGTITGNEATYEGGGGVYNADGAFTMDGGAITANKANGTGKDYCLSSSSYSQATFSYSHGTVGTPGSGGIGMVFTYYSGDTLVTLVGTPAAGDLLLFEQTTERIARNDTGTDDHSIYLKGVDGRDAMRAPASSPASYTLTDTVPDGYLLYLDGTAAGTLQHLALAPSADNKLLMPSVSDPTLDDHLFLGWNTRADGKGTWTRAGDALKYAAGSKRLTLYAVWNTTLNTVAYQNGHGGTLTPQALGNPARYVPGQRLPLQPPVVTDGSVFTGWHLEGDADKKPLTYTDPAWRGPVTLVAGWDDTATGTPAAMLVPGTSFSVQAGQDYTTLRPFFAAAYASGIDAMVFTSSAPQVAAVAADGTVTGAGSGRAVLTAARVYDPTKYVNITVQVTEAAGTLAFLATVDGGLQAVAATTMLAGDSATFSGLLYEAVGQTWVAATGYSFTSANSGVAGVTDASTGAVTAKKAGTAKITAQKGGASATITVTVVGADAGLERVSLNSQSLSLAVGKSATLKAGYAPNKAKVSAVWSVADQHATTAGGTVVTVDQKGKLAAVGGGTATVVLGVTDVFGTYRQAECTVTVTQPATGAKITTAGTLNGAGELVLTRLDTVPFPEATVLAVPLPANTTIQTVTCTPQVPVAAKIATTVAYYEDGRVIAGGKDGTATITAKTSNGKKATLKVRVVTPVTDMTLTAGGAAVTDLGAINTGETRQLAASTVGVTDSGSGAYRAPSDAKLAWASSDANVATVNQKGKVKAVGYGTATITVAPANNYLGIPAKTVNVEVVTQVKNIKIDQKAFTMQGGGTVQLTASANGGQALLPYGTVTWKSSNDDLLSVTGNGLAISNAVSKKTTVTVTAGHAGVKNATVKITLTPDLPVAAESVKLKKAAPTQLLNGKSYTPSLTVSPSKAANKNIAWTATATGTPANGGESRNIALSKAAWLDPGTGKLTGRLSAEYSEAWVKVTGTLQGAGTGANRTVAYTVRIARGAAKVTLLGSKTATAPATKLGLDEGGGVLLYAVADTVSPAGFTWKSSNPKVLQVYPGADGTSASLVALKGGSATITATVNDGTNKKATCKVTVTQQVRNVVLAGMTTAADGTVAASGTDLKNGYYGIAEVKLNKTRTLKSTLNVGYGKPKNKTVGYEVLAEYDGSMALAQPGSIVSLAAKTGKVKGLAKGYALVRVSAAECPAVDFEATVTTGKGSSAKEEFARNICLIEVT